jgi:outer membrane protein assembly factor BamB
MGDFAKNRRQFHCLAGVLALWMLTWFTGPVLAQSKVLSKAPAKEQTGVAKALLPKPQSFQTRAGRSGWRMTLAGGHTLATPAVYEDLLFLGGGFGSHEFYALSAETGLPVWTFKTGDDGPTAAVAAEGYVAYNTESCIVYVHEARSGRLLWQKWLGDPLMSQPAIGNGLLYIAYPGRDGSHHLGAFGLQNGRQAWDTAISGELISAPVIAGKSVVFATVDGTLYRVDAHSGRRHWRNACGVTSAPRVLGKTIYVSQRWVNKPEGGVDDGDSGPAGVVEGLNQVDLESGVQRHKVPLAAVPAPYLLTLAGQEEAYAANQAAGAASQKKYRKLISDGGSRLTQIKGDKAKEAEALKARIDAFVKTEPDDRPQEQLKDADQAAVLADELDALLQSTAQPEPEVTKVVKEVRQSTAKAKKSVQSTQKLRSSMRAKRKDVRAAADADAAVGFSQAPAAAKLHQAAGNLGESNVHSVWAYQGARPCLAGRLAVMVHGDTIRALERDTGRVVWQKTFTTKDDVSRPMTPAALAGGKLFLGTVDGRVLCLDPLTGRSLWQSEPGGHFVFEPAVENGRLYMTTNTGGLICLRTNDKNDAGWPMWGGSADHNGGGTHR